MYQHIIIHYHEIGLKGKNRGLFEKQLVQNIKAQLPVGSVKQIRRLFGRILVTLADPFDDTVKNGLAHVFGIASFAPAEICKPTLDDIQHAALRIVYSSVSYSHGRENMTRFAVRTKRADKQFPLTSDAVSREVGAAVREAGGGTVDLTNPDLTISIEILAKEAFVMGERYNGPGGLPVGSSGKVISLLSGGIDSPVAAWKVMKRGCETVFVHFHSYPHTSRASITKVKELSRLVGAYQPRSVLYLVPLAEAQREIVMRTDPKFRVLLYRRLMVRLAEELARRERVGALVTGESIGQVASQTLPNLEVTEAVAARPIFRPLIGDDKEEIITQAKRLGTYEISIQPHDDCCTLFIPKNQATHARISDLEREESKFVIPNFIEGALAATKKEII